MKSILLRVAPRWLLGMYHLKLAFLGAVMSGFPSRKLRVIGVTGTKGKTTVVDLLHRILEENGKAVASLSSLRFKIKDKEERNELKMTMPGRFKLQRFLRRALHAGCEYAVLEVTSQGIAQHRHRFIRFVAAVMTNVAPEHLEAHGGFEPYLQAKLKLFGAVGTDGVVVINRDDPNAKSFAEAAAAKKIWYGKERIVMEDKTLTIKNIHLTSRGLSFAAHAGGESDPTPAVYFASQLIGEFNFYNILAAVSLGLSEDVPLEKIAEAIARAPGVPGRMEYVQREPFAVVVDYAHTPDSLEAVYKTIRDTRYEIRDTKLICVLGSAGGGRDRWKRPELGKIAAEHCDEIILTNEDPYDENPTQILSEIKSGMSNVKCQMSNVRMILDRREAIKTALAMAQSGDTVIITGKGAEPWLMGPNGTKIPWDDRTVAREALRSKLHLREKTAIVSTI